MEDVVAGRAEYPVKSKQFWQPDLALVAPAVEAALRENFQSVSVGGAVVIFTALNMILSNTVARAPFK